MTGRDFFSTDGQRQAGFLTGSRCIALCLFIGWRLGLLALLFACLLFGWTRVQAHGGVIVDNGVTDDYEWLAVVSPYPISAGDTMLTLLVYDLDSSEPINGLAADVLLRRPGDPTPCCSSAQHLGPFVLLAEPEEFPGDYSAALTFDATGAWEALFQVRAGEKSFSATVPLNVVAASVAQVGNEAQTDSSLSTTTATFGQLTSGAPGGTQSPFGSAWWVWALLALIPVGLIFAWAFRPLEGK